MKQIKMTINSLNLDYIKEKVEKFNSKATKLHKQQLELTYSNSYIDSTDKDDIKELIDIAINQYEELIIANYKIIAEIDHTYPIKNFVKSYTTITQEQEEKWQYVDSHCEHCHSNRKRNKTYMLQNIKTLQYMQVGKTCLKDFLGYDIQNTLTYFNLLKELQFDIVEANNKTSKVEFFKVTEILQMIQKEIKENGYKSGKAKYEGRVCTTTGEDVKYKIHKGEHFPNISQTQQQEFETIINYILESDTTDEGEYLQDFYNNLKNILKYDYCTFKDVNILATTFVTYDILKAKEEKRVSNFVGNVKDKIEIEVTLEGCFGYDTQYGYMHINLYKDKQGNIYKWSSKNTLELEQGEWKVIKGTVKKHEEYDGQKQTVLTRCKLV